MTRQEDSRLRLFSPTLVPLFWGSDDPRLRASWRVLLSWALLVLWSVLAVRAGSLTKPLWHTYPGPAKQILNITVGTAIFLALFILFARFIDHRPIANYGIDRSPKWVAGLTVGFLAILFATGAWHGIGVLLGWTTLELAVELHDFTTLVWLLLLLIPWYLSGLTQSLLSVALITKNAAEGLHTRGTPLTYAGIGAVIVALLFFSLRHSPSTVTRVLSLVFGGTVFVLLYVHSGTLALSIGAIGSANYTNRFIFTNTVAGGTGADAVTVFELSQSLPEVVTVVAQTNLPVMLLTYVIAAGWLVTQRDGLIIHPSLIQWRRSDDRSRSE